MGLTEQKEKYPTLTDRFEWTYITSAFILVTGAYLDAWSHIHVPELETFFTPSHAVLYTGGLMISILMGTTMFRNIKTGFSLWRSIPEGYQMAVLGFVLLIGSGLGDMVWHTIFGVEQDLEAAFSFTHLGIITGIVLLMLSPTQVPREEEQLNFIPLLANALALLGLNVISSWSHPLVKLYPTLNYSEPEIGYSLGILSILLQTVFLMGILLPIYKEAVLPVGSFTVILGIDALYLGFLQSNFVFLGTYIVSGIVADFLYIQRRNGNRIFWFRVFSVGIPIIVFSTYLIALSFIDEILWNAHILSGAIVFPAILSGFIGLAIARDENDFN